MSYFFAVFAAIALIFGMMTGNIEAVGRAVSEGAEKAVEVSIGLCGMLCLWSGLTEIMSRSGMMQKLAKLLKKPLSWLFPKQKDEPEVMENISANVAANLMGLGNAATPLSIRAATILHKSSGNTGVASDDAILLMVINSGSIQIIPATIAAIRAAAGATNPFDILPAVWVASVISFAVGVFAAKILSRIWREKV